MHAKAHPHLCTSSQCDFCKDHSAAAGGCGPIFESVASFVTGLLGSEPRLLFVGRAVRSIL